MKASFLDVLGVLFPTKLWVKVALAVTKHLAKRTDNKLDDEVVTLLVDELRKKGL